MGSFCIASLTYQRIPNKYAATVSNRRLGWLLGKLYPTTVRVTNDANITNKKPKTASNTKNNIKTIMLYQSDISRREHD